MPNRYNVVMWKGEQERKSHIYITALNYKQATRACLNYLLGYTPEAIKFSDKKVIETLNGKPRHSYKAYVKENGVRISMALVEADYAY